MTAALITDTAYRAVDFIETYTGRAFFPKNPSVEGVNIIDIAHALSQQCRYSGHTRYFYSTAQHCCYLAEYIENNGGTPLDALQILMHDAAEAYLVDIPRPVKQHMPEYRQQDRDITMVIRQWYGCGDMPIPPWQDEIDSRIIFDEREQLMSDSGLDWQHKCERLGIPISQWTSERAEQQFLIRYANYMRAITGKHQYVQARWGVTMEARVNAGGSDSRVVTDLGEVDIRGGVGRVLLRDVDGHMVRDRNAGTFPRPSWKWLHGKFELLDAHESHWAKNLGEVPL